MAEDDPGALREARGAPERRDAAHAGHRPRGRGRWQREEPAQRQVPARCADYLCRAPVPGARWPPGKGMVQRGARGRGSGGASGPGPGLERAWTWSRGSWHPTCCWAGASCVGWPSKGCGGASRAAAGGTATRSRRISGRSAQNKQKLWRTRQRRRRKAPAPGMRLCQVRRVPGRRRSTRQIQKLYRVGNARSDSVCRAGADRQDKYKSCTASVMPGQTACAGQAQIDKTNTKAVPNIARFRTVPACSVIYKCGHRAV